MHLIGVWKQKNRSKKKISTPSIPSLEIARTGLQGISPAVTIPFLFTLSLSPLSSIFADILLRAAAYNVFFFIDLIVWQKLIQPGRPECQRPVATISYNEKLLMWSRVVI